MPRVGGLKAYVEMTTGVPSWSSGFSLISAWCDTRRHPVDTDFPIDVGWFVPWSASWKL